MLDAQLARRLKLIGFDVDGIFTDGGIYVGQVGDHPLELKRFHIQDGLGVKLLRQAGLAVVLVSGRRSDATDLRARELHVDEVVQDSAAKLPAFTAILERRGVSWEECAFVGDDLPDLPLLDRVALPITVPGAVPEVRARARMITQAGGGQGAVREVAEVILRARGAWDDLVTDYLVERGDDARRSARAR